MSLFIGGNIFICRSVFIILLAYTLIHSFQQLPLICRRVLFSLNSDFKEKVDLSAGKNDSCKDRPRVS